MHPLWSIFASHLRAQQQQKIVELTDNLVNVFIDVSQSNCFHSGVVLLFEELTRAKKEKDQTEKRNLQSERDFGSPTNVILSLYLAPRVIFRVLQSSATSVCLPPAV